MGLYDYKAVTADGRMVAGRLDAHNPADLETRLKRIDLDLISGEPVRSPQRLGGRIPRRELINFCFHLEQLTLAGVPVLDGLRDLRDSLENLRFRTVVASLIEALEGGQTLSQAMASHPRVFGTVFVSLVRAGEASGRLPEVLAGLVASLKWEDEIGAQTKRVALYPAFVGTIVVAAALFLLAYLVPQLKQFVANLGQALPLQTRALFFVSDVLVGYWYLIVPAPVLAGGLLYRMLRRDPLMRLRFDGLKLGLPIIGDVLRKIVLARLASTFALLYAAGIPILEAVETTRGVVGNRVIRGGLERVEELIRDGQNVTAAFHAVGLFPPLVVRMLRIGEHTGGLDRALANVAYFYGRDVKEAVERLQAMIEPALTVLLGLILGWVMLAVLAPVYDVISRIRP